MKEIEVVIKIPEDIMMRVSMGMKNLGDTDVFDTALDNGVVLPYQHGRLVDADILYREIENGIRAGNYEEGYEHYAHINNMDDCLECIKYEDVVLEGTEEQV